MDVNKEMFKTFTQDQKLDYIYDILDIICIRLEKVERNKWINRILGIIAYCLAGAVTAVAAYLAK